MDFDKFIANERELSDKLMDQLQIFDHKFDENDYLFLKPIFEDKLLILKFNIIINDITKDIRMCLLVLSDFLHTIVGYGWNNMYGGDFVISRNEYLSKIHTRAYINHLIGYDYYKYILIHKKLLIGLTSGGVLIKSNTPMMKKGVRGKETWSSITYFKLSVDVGHISPPLGYSHSPFKIINLASRQSLGSFRNIWKMKRKKREMDDFSITEAGVIKSNNIGLIISSVNYNIISNIVDNEKNRILSLVKCGNIEEYFEKINGLSSDIKELRLLYSEHNMESSDDDSPDDVKKDLNTMYREVMNEKTLLMSVYQKLLSIHLLNTVKFDRIIYLPCFMDNRGRQYYGTLISPTFYILYRHLYIFRDVKDFTGLEGSRFYLKIIIHKYLLGDYLHLPHMDDRNSYILLILFFEVGKNFIDKKDIMYKTSDIIKCGIDNYTKLNRNLDFDDMIYIEKIYNAIENVIFSGSTQFIDNMLIYKDATSSGLQNYGKILKYKKEMLTYLNLDGDDWCDTYQYIIRKYLVLEDDISFLFKRKYWKSTIMTIPYNSTWRTCFRKFIDALRSDDILYWEMCDKERIRIKKIHEKFYNDVKYNIKDHFYQNNVIINDKDEIRFKYNKWIAISKNEYKINYDNKRDKYSNMWYLQVYDEKKTITANEANNMHYLDGWLVRYIISTVEVIPIHDCFGVRLCELHIMMDAVNNHYSNVIQIQDYENGYSNTYCPHILI